MNARIFAMAMNTALRENNRIKMPAVKHNCSAAGTFYVDAAVDVVVVESLPVVSLAAVVLPCPLDTL